MPLLRIIVTFTLLLFCNLQTLYAQGFSYIYIQGDKQTPFYIKLEDQMMPRYGKNYSILPQLAAGPVKIQVLFQQNKYLPQSYTITVPENSFRGFLLVKKEDVFTLYDIHQQFYIYPGNKAEDDKYNAEKVPVYTMTDADKNIEAQLKNDIPPLDNSDKQPRFIESIELSHEKDDGERTIAVIKKNDVKAEEIKTNNDLPLIPNSDCPQPVGDNEFRDILVTTYDKKDEARVKYLMSQMENCYTTNQAKILAKTLPTDPQRYSFLKKVFPRITDQSAFSSLEEILIADEWKDYFRLITSN